MPRKPFSLDGTKAFTAAFVICLGAALFAAATFSTGDLVRLTRGEMLSADGKEIASAAKGQEFTVTKHEAARGIVEVIFFKDDGTPVVATLPADALEPIPPDGWMDLAKGIEAFRDQRFDDAKRLLLRASQDQQSRALATPVVTRINAALVSAAPASRQTFIVALQGLRDTAEQLSKAGYQSLALPLDEGVDKLAARVLGGSPPAAPASKVDRDDLARRIAISNRTLMRVRQLVAQRRLSEAWRSIKEGQKAEPARPELVAFQARVEHDRDEADEQYAAAMRMRRFPGGETHALNAIERGLKLCTDHLRLRELKKEMAALFEDHTAPQVTPTLIAAAKTKTPASVLEQGRKLYTDRCTECHDLELLSSRSFDGWQKMVGSMGRRAHLDGSDQARILDYIAAAQSGMDAGK